jgi:glycosyltransferase involved in cell wall biosynthesis
MSPQIAAVIPCYNQSHFLGEALVSLRRQELEDWEAVVVDDCSTRGDVGAVVEAFADPRVRLARHATNRGLAAARNTGVREARADLLMPLDADDRLAPPFLRRAVESFRDPAVAFVFCDLQLFGAGEGVWRYGPFEPAEMGRRQAVPACSAFRRAVWAAVGGFCEAPELCVANEDWDFWMAVVADAHRGAHIAAPLYEYRRTEGSLSQTQKPMLSSTHDFIAARHRQFLEAHGVLNDFLRFGYEASALAQANLGCFEEAEGLARRAVELGSSDLRISALAFSARLPRRAVGPYLRMHALCSAARMRLNPRRVLGALTMRVRLALRRNEPIRILQ